VEEGRTATIIAFPRDWTCGEADDWFARGCALELTCVDAAREAYERALEIQPDHAGALVNLGRLLHESGDVCAAEERYRLALDSDPKNATAAFNLGVALEDAGDDPRAIGAYQRALSLDPRFADASYNLACLYERVGDRGAALRQMAHYRRLVTGSTALKGA
jgi:tetratricopeptide (TPR) repeat protein